MEKPRWLVDVPEIQALLAEFLDRLDRKTEGGSQQLRPIKVEPKRFPALFRNDADADRQWILLKSLHGAVLEVELDHRRTPLEAEYVGARLRFLPNAEDTVRLWLDRPRRSPYAVEWREAVARYAAAFADGGAALAARPLQLPGKTAVDLAAGFARVADYADAGLSLRQLSARCFWGHSKFLDDRAALLTASMPSLHVQPRAIVVNVFLPPEIEGVLFIENQDSYVRAVAGNPDAARSLALVFASGFRGSAQRIRERDGVSLHYHAACTDVHRATFESWWFSRTDEMPAWFWGDLDYSGLAILKALRSRFGDVRAWEWGYAAMLRIMQDGGGHTREAADKEDQSHPGTTGCAYADQVLLPAIQQYGLFVDQEAVN